jgi:hypothetical protein
VPARIIMASAVTPITPLRHSYTAAGLDAPARKQVSCPPYPISDARCKVLDVLRRGQRAVNL